MARILITDDDNVIRRMVRQVLEKEGYEVVEAPDGAQGLELYRKMRCDLVIADIIMPEKEGIGMIGELMREFPNAKIIAISGGGRVSPADYLKIARDFGAMRTLVKPIRKDELLKDVRELLEADWRSADMFSGLSRRTFRAGAE